jgi:hypothetical protein
MCSRDSLNEKGNITRLPGPTLGASFVFFTILFFHISLSLQCSDPMAQKEATIYIIDVGRSMGERRHGRSVTDLEWAMQYVWDKITTTVRVFPFNIHGNHSPNFRSALVERQRMFRFLLCVQMVGISMQCHLFPPRQV